MMHLTTLCMECLSVANICIASDMESFELYIHIILYVYVQSITFVTIHS